MWMGEERKREEERVAGSREKMNFQAYPILIATLKI
jgi:hypothetical protein